MVDKLFSVTIGTSLPQYSPQRYTAFSSTIVIISRRFQRCHTNFRFELGNSSALRDVLRNSLHLIFSADNITVYSGDALSSCRYSIHIWALCSATHMLLWMISTLLCLFSFKTCIRSSSTKRFYGK